MDHAKEVAQSLSWDTLVTSPRSSYMNLNMNISILIKRLLIFWLP